MSDYEDTVGLALSSVSQGYRGGGETSPISSQRRSSSGGGSAIGVHRHHHHRHHKHYNNSEIQLLGSQRSGRSRSSQRSGRSSIGSRGSRKSTMKAPWGDADNIPPTTMPVAVPSTNKIDGGGGGGEIVVYEGRGQRQGGKGENSTGIGRQLSSTDTWHSSHTTKPSTVQLLSRYLGEEQDKRSALRERYNLNTVWKDLQGAYDTAIAQKALEQFDKYDNAHTISNHPRRNNSMDSLSNDNITYHHHLKRAKKTRRKWNKHVKAQAKSMLKRTQSDDKMTLNFV